MSVTNRPTVPPLDFTVVREDWNRYDLADNSILKVKVILTKIHRNGTQYSVDFNHLFVVLTNERGEVDMTVYSSQQLLDSITQDIRYTTTAQDWNEYVVDDGTRVRIQPMVTRVARTSRFDRHGEPIYWVETQGNVRIQRPNPTG